MNSGSVSTGPSTPIINLLFYDSVDFGDDKLETWNSREPYCCPVIIQILSVNPLRKIYMPVSRNKN